jgi:hypothetical protein
MIDVGPFTDLLVGGLSTVLGAVGLAAAAGNWNWFYQLRIAQWMETNWGRGSARAYYAILGLLLIALGLAIMSGMRVWR